MGPRLRDPVLRQKPQKGISSSLILVGSLSSRSLQSNSLGRRSGSSYCFCSSSHSSRAFFAHSGSGGSWPGSRPYFHSSPSMSSSSSPSSSSSSLNFDSSGSHSVSSSSSSSSSQYSQLALAG